MKVVGIKEVKYISKKTGNEVRGFDIHGLYQSASVKGCMTDKVFLSDYIVEKHGGALPELGDELNVFYNRFGRIESFEIIPAQK